MVLEQLNNGEIESSTDISTTCPSLASSSSMMMVGDRFFTTVDGTYQEAEETCAQLGSVLATIKSDKEFQEVLAYTGN